MDGKVKPLAIVGMACRFPRGLESIEALWNALKSRFSAIDLVPNDRWTVDRYFSSNPIAKGKSYIRRGGFLKQDVRTFDANFFGISPRDAENMDPQQRLLLEVVWEAFENSGLILPDYAQRSVGVYVGGFMLDHMISQMGASNRSAINQNTAAGMMMTMLSNRISHTFDFRGPSLSIDTACSSSLVAFHYACQDLWNGNSEMAIVGGANVMLRPEYPMGMCKGQFLSRDGECKSFDSRGDGYGRGEGAGIVLLKPLEVAERDGDPILAQVIATGSNQDGRTPGISMPSGSAQRALIEQVCERYEIDPASIDYVECHGTGTAIGDPTESGAIGAVYGAARKAAGKSPVLVGSIKSNIGHLEAAAGVAGIIKATLTLLHRETSPLANLQEVNPALDFETLHVRLSDDRYALGDSKSAEIRIAVNSFGYGGSNAHAVLQSVAQQPSSAGSNGQVVAKRELPYILPISARSEKALQALASHYCALLNGPASLDDILYSAIRHRAGLSHRAVARGTSREEILAALESLSSGSEHAHCTTGVEPFQGHRLPVIVFTGMGPQWWGMGQELYKSEPVYRAAVEEADQAFQKVSGFSILSEMLKHEDESRVQVTEYAQPANFVLQIGLWELLKSYGVQAGAFVGHSVGELASAYAAGVLSLHDAMTVCFHRSRLQATCKGTGSMLAVGMSKEQIEVILADYAGKVSVAAANGPSNVTIAGDADAIADIANQLTQQDVFNRVLQVEVPYHSPMMDPIMEDLREALARVQPRLPQAKLYSTVTGQTVDDITFGADYWPKNVRQPVEFATAITSLLEEGYNTFLEVGPHPVLATSIQDSIRSAGKDGRLVHTLRRNQLELENVQNAVMSLVANGCDIDWTKLCPRGHFVQLPTYPWQREHLWVENERAMQDRIAPITHPMLGIQEAPGAPVYRNDFDHEPMLYLRDHVVSGLPILPAAGYVETLLELAGLQFEAKGNLAIRDFKILAPMVITAERGLDCVTTFEPGSSTATIRSLENGRLGAGQVHVTARIAQVPAEVPQLLDLASLRTSHPHAEDVAKFYSDLALTGLAYGPAFRPIRELYMVDSGAGTLARIEATPEAEPNPELYALRPTILDACFQALMPMLGDSDTTFLPNGFDELNFHVAQLPDSIWSLAETVSRTERQIVCNITMLSEQGEVLASLRGMKLSAASRRERVDQFGDKVKRQILTYEWTYGEALTEPKRLGHWLIFGDETRLAQSVMDGMERYGATISGLAAFGEAPTAEGKRHIVRPQSLEDMQAMLTALGDLDGVVCLHGLDATSASTDPTGEQAIAALITLTQAMLTSSSTRTPRVYVVTNSAHETSDQDSSVEPAQSAINGFARVAYNELDGLRFSTIDIPTRTDQRIVDNLVLELLCDSEYDEIALRGSLRLHSELTDSDVLSADALAPMPLSDDLPVAVRAARRDSEGVGTARVLEIDRPKISPQGIHVRVESTLVPTSVLLDPDSDSLVQPLIEIVGTVIECGNEVTDLSPGMRVCGFAPADIASHIAGERTAFSLVELSDALNHAPTIESQDVERLLCGLSECTRAHSVVMSMDSESVKSALVYGNAVGLALAAELIKRNVRVTLAQDESSTDAPVAGVHSCFYGSDRIASAVREFTQGRGFDVVAVPCTVHQGRLGWTMLANGGTIVDLDDMPRELALPAQAAQLIRSDLSSASRKGQQFESAVREAVKSILSGEVNTLPALSVSISDLAWQKLPLADANLNLILSYETNGSDLPVVKSDAFSFSPNGTYLITGGFGGFGRKTAEWLIENGARSIVLTGRTGADSEERVNFVQSLERSGATVLAAACDTSDSVRLAELLAQIADTMPPLRGIFHSGAVIQDEPIGEMRLSTFETVMRSKALGAWNLHKLTETLELDHFVLYSSLANLVGNSRQSAYSAANGFLNGLARMRVKAGMAGTSVNWGAISDVGVVAQDEKLEQFLRYTGLRGISSTEGLDLLKVGLKRSLSQFGVTVITSWADWARFETRGSQSPRFASLIKADSVGQDNSTRQALLEELSKLDPTDQVDLLASLIVEIVAHVLKASPDDVPIDRAINQLGVDSLMATEIQMTLDSQLGLQISILELIGDSTIRSLAAKSLKNLFAASAAV